MRIRAIFKKGAAIICLAALSSCSSPSYLFTDLEYSSLQDLASYHVRTPTLCTLKEAEKQSLFVKWKVLRRQLPVTVKIAIIEENLEEKEKTLLYTSHKGSYTVCRSWQELSCGKGILAYRVRIFDKNESLLQEEKHKMWVSLQPKLRYEIKTPSI